MHQHQPEQTIDDHPKTPKVAEIERRAALFAGYLSPAELVLVRQRMLDHAADWEVLIGQASQCMTAGAAPTEAAVQDIARQWSALFRASYAGDNVDLDGKVRNAFACESGLSEHIDAGLTMLMQGAMKHLHQAHVGQHGAADNGPKPSAHLTASLRAAHQLLEVPVIFSDPLAVTILGPRQEAEMRADPDQYNNPLTKVMRATMAVRSRLAEDSWLQAYRQGVRQYVILGAGLDTFAYRSNTPSDVQLFEVDLPSMQGWKRECLRQAGIKAPDNLRYVGIDFVQTSLQQGLLASGFNPDLPAIFCWLGVSMYLATDVVLQTLRFVATCTPGSGIVFDYLLQPELLAPAERAGLELMAARMAAQGEPLQSYFDPETLERHLHDSGIGHIEHFGARALSERYLAGRSDGLRLSEVFHMIRATV